VNFPEIAHLDYSGTDWDCNRAVPEPECLYRIGAFIYRIWGRSGLSQHRRETRFSDKFLNSSVSVAPLITNETLHGVLEV
jgi:hypothetical protein